MLEIYEEDPAKFLRLKQKVKQNFDFEIGDVTFSREKDINVHANYKESLEKESFDLDLSTAGSGFLQILQILAPIYRYSSPSQVVLLDEPDAHLHPNLQRTIARVIQEVASEELLQIIISTHSTAIIREVAPESVIPVTNKRSVLKGLGSSEEIETEIDLRLDNYLAAKASIAGKLVFVEDSEKSLLQQIDNLLGTNLFEGKSTLPMISSQGKDDKVPFRIKTTLQKITGSEIEVYFIRDGDGLPKSWRDKLIEYAKTKDVKLILLPRHEIESFLLNPDLILRSLQSEGSSIDKMTIKKILIQAMNEAIGLSRYNFDRTLRDNLYKTGRLINAEYSHGDAEKEAAKIRRGYEELESFEELVAVAPAKESLSIFTSKILSEKGLKVSERKLKHYLQASDIDELLVKELRSIRTNDNQSKQSITEDIELTQDEKLTPKSKQDLLSEQEPI